MRSFTDAMKNLNSAQQAAVENIDGPLLVIAGPGTGKTQLLSVRVANIIKNTDVSPENILCLTFTNKAANNMQVRLNQLIGPTGTRVVVKTFHSFAAEIMNLYPDHFWNGARLTIASDPIQIEIIESVLNDLPLDNPLATKFASAFTATNDVLKSISLVKDAGIAPTRLKNILNQNVDYIEQVEDQVVKATSDRLNIKNLNKLRHQLECLPDQGTANLSPLLPLNQIMLDSLDAAIEFDQELAKTTNTGKWKRRFVQVIDGKKGMYNEKKRNKWWLELANVYSKYRQRMHERGYYDYADLIVEVISQLRSNSELRANVQERFLYTLIDEFQDTNPAQFQLAQLVADHFSAEGRPNIMAVGDDDQSIYKFNGAEINNILAFKGHYPEAELIVLEDNYRSTQSILDLSKKIIQQAENRIVKREKSLSKNLVAKNDELQQIGTIEHLQFRTREEQFYAVANHINNIYNKTDELAVLARSHDSLTNIAAKLDLLNVPISYERKKNILVNPTIEQLIILAKIVNGVSEGNEPVVNKYLAETLKHSMWGIEPRLLWQFAISNSHSPHWLDAMADSAEKKLSSAAKWLLGLGEELPRQPLSIALEYLLGLREFDGFVSPIKSQISGNVTNNEFLENLSAVNMLRNLTNEFMAGDTVKLNDFLRFIEINQNNNKILSDESPFLSGENPVRLLTVHKAKGLEFDKVILLDTQQINWQPKISGRKSPANLPLQRYGEDYDDYVRLLYVAATRAKHSFICTSYMLSDTNEEVLPSQIIMNVLPPQLQKQPSRKDVVEIIKSSLIWPRLSSPDMKYLLKPRLDNYSLSVTHLLSFLDVTSGGPAKFFERHILRLPDVKSPHQAFGTAIHEALRRAQLQSSSDKFDLSSLRNAFKQALFKEQLSSNDYEKFSVKGTKLLDKLFLDLKYILPKGSHCEQSISDVSLGTARINGKYDRIDLIDDESIRIVDYKTGKPLNNLMTYNKSQQTQAWKHRMQLIFYVLLARSSRQFSRFKNISGQMVYVEAETINALSRDYAPSQQELDELQALINNVWTKIMNLDFPDTTSFSQDYSGIVRFKNDLMAN